MSIRQLENGRYQARVSYRTGVKYAEKTKMFKRKTDATRWENEMQYKLNEGYNVLNAEMSFGDYYEKWIDTYKRPAAKKHTVDTYLNSLRLVRSYFKRTALKDVTRAQYQGFMNEYGSSHRINTSKKLNSQVRSAVADAVIEKIIDRDFTYRVKVTGKDPKSTDTKFLKINEYNLLRDYLIEHAGFDNMSQAILLFQLETGTRFEEACGMTWDHIDFDKGLVTIDRQWDANKKEFGKTKGNGGADGVITIPPAFMDWLLKLKEQAEKYFSPNKYMEFNPQQLVFFSKRYGINRNDSVNQILENICQKLNIRVVTTHAMRHTHASVLIMKGATFPYVQHRLRHKNLQTTINTYVHLVEEKNGESNKMAMKLFSEGF